MIKLCIALLLTSMLLLSGCATKPVTKTQIVHVPIATKCESTVRVTEIAEYPTQNLDKDMTLYEKVISLMSENKLLRGQNTELKAALSECTK
jgi:uncharacterized lipoprotein YajG